ncbi:peptidyl-tRNA hydrolase ICT1 [Cryptococcus deuterogattii MMRL2647]|nr:peptidyl-tRNA hydrolase ICT1 [Cryptococcus deuterogattii MMRL2647]
MSIVQLLPRRLLSTTSCLAAKPPVQLLHVPKLDSETEHLLARQWIDAFTLEDIPKEGWVATRSRSSGPGGQHVNKTESKVTIRCNLDQAVGRWLPKFVMSALTKSTHYHHSPPSLLITSQKTRSAPQNQASALTLLHQTIVNSANSLIINPTSPEQKERVKELEKKEKEQRLEMKKRRSMKKASRRE